jgi:hypothetical protein
MSIYPNPSRGYFSITSTAKQVLIYNMVGQLVKEFKGDFNANHSYPIDSLTAGNYLVKIVGEDSKMSTLKVVRQ